MRKVMRQMPAQAGRFEQGHGEAVSESSSDETRRPCSEAKSTVSGLLDAALARENLLETRKRVRANKGAAGVDGLDIDQTAARLRTEWPAIRDQLRAGTYRPQPVKRVEIPKPDGEMRKLGISTVADRIAQQVVKARLEPEVDPLFHADSYGYRPGKSALDAVGQARQRCWRYDWVVDLDIKGFFDNLDQNLLLRAVKKHAPQQWIVLYSNAG